MEKLVESPLSIEEQCLIQVYITTSTQPPCQVNGACSGNPDIFKKGDPFHSFFSQDLSHFNYVVVSFPNTRTKKSTCKLLAFV